MLKQSKLFILLSILGLSLAACSDDSSSKAPAVEETKTETTPPPAKEEVEETAEAEESDSTEELSVEGEIGVAECDEYISKYAACMEQMPEAGRAAYQQSLDQMVSTWQQAAEASDASKSALAQGCQMALHSSAESMKALGCDW